MATLITYVADGYVADGYIKTAFIYRPLVNVDAGGIMGELPVGSYLDPVITLDASLGGGSNEVNLAFAIGNLGVDNLNGGIGASNNTWWRGDGVWAAIPSSSGGTVTSVSVVSANGFAGTVATPTTTPAITLTTSITGILKGSASALVAATAGTDYSAGTSALATGILKSTTTTGDLSIAVAGDFPTLNQSTTGNAATATALQTGRTINTVTFDGTANIVVDPLTEDSNEGVEHFVTFVNSSTPGHQRLATSTALAFTPSTGNLTLDSINNLTITAPASFATITIANEKSFTVSNTLTLNGTDGSTVSFGAGGTVAYTGGTLAQFAATTSLQLKTLISDETGSGALVFADSPTLVTPNLGTPSTLVGTNITGTAAGLTAGNATLAATVTTNANLTGPITSVGNATSVAAQTGTGSTFVMDTSPTLVTPILGVAAATSINKVAITAPATSAVLTIADGKTLSVSNTLTFTGTDASSVAFGTGGTVAYVNGNLGTPTALVGTNITGTAAGLTAGTVTTNANLTGEVTSVGNAATLTNSAVIGKVLTGYISGPGTISASDSILSAIQKLNGNISTISMVASNLYLHSTAGGF